MQTYDYALVKQQRERKAFLADRNYLLGHGLFLTANLAYWLYELLR